MGISLDPLWHFLRHDDPQYWRDLQRRAASPDDFSSFAGLVYSIPVSVCWRARLSSMHA